MALKNMFPAAVNSRQTELALAIDDTQTNLTVLNGLSLPPAPNLLTLGTDETAETIFYTGLNNNELTGVTRGFQSAPKSWDIGTKVARYFTAYDHDTFRENIEDVSRRVDNIVIPNASLTTKGITMLSKATNGNRDDVAATESAVAAAFQYGVERKSEVVAALNSIGVSASTSETWDQLIPKIAAVIRATGNATAAQVLAGSTFSNAAANGLTGSMVNRGAVSQNITAQNGSYTIPAGYHNGSGVIRAVIANLIAANIRSGVNVGGVVGTLIEGPRYATGTISPPENVGMRFQEGNFSYFAFPLTVSGLGFRPTRIVIRADPTFDSIINVYDSTIRNAIPSASGTNSNFYQYTDSNNGSALSYLRSADVWEYTGNGKPSEGAYVNDSTFRLPVSKYRTYKWEAFGV
ncbi:tail fiber protein [Paenibacillus sp. FSL F4-0087]|uniref:tail fiber protein n=1 Tax=Paenibacillus sp. FSL F4-0087 TaxID=2921368 RepID=UPI00096EA8A2|nr:hypothetical protein BK122_15670 [Paenibacillus pabuli]